jgi:hypothetical protein
VRRPIARARPERRSASQRGAVRRSCHTIARATGAPVARSHSSVVSRWFVIPIDRTDEALTPSWRSAPSTAAHTESHTSPPSCSTQPGCG